MQHISLSSLHSNGRTVMLGVCWFKRVHICTHRQAYYLIIFCISLCYIFSVWSYKMLTIPNCSFNTSKMEKKDTTHCRILHWETSVKVRMCNVTVSCTVKTLCVEWGEVKIHEVRFYPICSVINSGWTTLSRAVLWGQGFPADAVASYL